MKKTALMISLLIVSATQARHYHTYGHTYEVITYEPCVTYIPTCVPQPVIVEYYEPYHEPDIISSTFNLVGSILDCATESQRARRARKAEQKLQEQKNTERKPEPKGPEQQKKLAEQTDAELAKVKAELEATRKELKELKAAVK